MRRRKKSLRSNLNLKQLINKHQEEFYKITHKNKKVVVHEQWNNMTNLIINPIPAYNMFFDKYSESYLFTF